MSFEGENLLVGIVCLALVPLIGARMLRALQTGRIPLYRTYLERSESESRFFALFALHGISMLLIAFIAADLLLGLGFRN